MVVEQNVASQRSREEDIARRERDEQLRVERDGEKARQQLLMMEQNVKQTQEAMEVMSRAFAERQAEERERQGLQERAEEYARAEAAQLLRNELVDADRARAAIQ
eukprot:6392377-Alexandrium_andersonii.AAC.1